MICRAGLSYAENEKGRVSKKYNYVITIKKIVIPFQRNFQFQAFVTLLQTHNAEVRHSKKITSTPCTAYSGV